MESKLQAGELPEASTPVPGFKMIGPWDLVG
jgi:hypothetical protein